MNKHRRTQKDFFLTLLENRKLLKADFLYISFVIAGTIEIITLLFFWFVSLFFISVAVAGCCYYSFAFFVLENSSLSLCSSWVMIFSESICSILVIADGFSPVFFASYLFSFLSAPRHDSALTPPLIWIPSEPSLNLWSSGYWLIDCRKVSSPSKCTSLHWRLEVPS